MSNPSDAVVLSPFMFGEVFLAGALSLQRRIAEEMLAAFDTAAEAMRNGLRAGVSLADGIGHAETPVAAGAAGLAWAHGHIGKGLTSVRALFERMAAWSGAPAPHPASAPAVGRAPVVPQQEIRVFPKPPAGKLRRTPILADKGKKPARPGAK